MTVGDVLKKVGIMIGRPDICDVFNGGGKVGYESYEDMTFLMKILNLVVGDLSNTYLPLITEQDVYFEDGKFATTSF